MLSPFETAQRFLTLGTHRISTLPVLVLMPHSACNCRCVMCHNWRSNANGRELTCADLEGQLSGVRGLKVRWVVLSGGEALMHSNLWSVCGLAREAKVKRITLLSNGLLLRQNAKEIVAHCDEVIVSLDGSRELHDGVRQIPRAYDRLAEGVSALKTIDPSFRVTGRCVVQKLNHRDIPNVVRAARELHLDQISFLAADSSATAFGRSMLNAEQAGADVALDLDDLAVFHDVLGELIATSGEDFATGFIAERPDKLWRIYRYFAALLGQGEFPGVVCNAPWVSAVVEADGTVRPCFFHRALGSIHQQPLNEILNSGDAIRFRRSLNVKTDAICRRCVCTLHLGSRASV